MTDEKIVQYITPIGIGAPWVANELRWVTAAGIPVRLAALSIPAQEFYDSAWAEQIHAETEAIYPIPLTRLLCSALQIAVRQPIRFTLAAFIAAFGNREHIRARIAGVFHFLVACDWIRRSARNDIGHIHSQWIHAGGTVAMYSSWLLGTSFSFTGHAADLFRDRCALRDKISRAKFIVCISEFHRQFFLENGARPEQLHIVYCGIDPSHFSFQLPDRIADEPHHVLSSGRLVDKKGFGILVEACAVLHQRGEHFRCTIAGSGPLESELRVQISRLGLDGIVTVTGQPLKQEGIPAFMRTGHIYCLPCVWAKDNDVDGLPQMLMEAMACGLPAVSTRLVGIPDLIIHEQTGLLVEPNQVEALADALQRLAHDPELTNRLALAGRRHIEEKFDIHTCLEPLIHQFRLSLGLAEQEQHEGQGTIASERDPIATSA